MIVSLQCYKLGKHHLLGKNISKKLGEFMSKIRKLQVGLEDLTKNVIRKQGANLAKHSPDLFICQNVTECISVSGFHIQKLQICLNECLPVFSMTDLGF